MQIPFPWLSPCCSGIYNFTLCIPAEGEEEGADGRALQVSRTLPEQPAGLGLLYCLPCLQPRLLREVLMQVRARLDSPAPAGAVAADGHW